MTKIKTIQLIKIKIDKETAEKIDELQGRGHAFCMYTDHEPGQDVLIIEEID